MKLFVLLINYSKNRDFHKYWEDTQKLKNLQDKQKDNHYYIDTFLTKLILEALLSFSNDTSVSIKYVKSTSIEKVPRDQNHLFAANEVAKNKAKIITPKSDIDISSGDLNTFATKGQVKVSHGMMFGMEDFSMETQITFPTKLIFELTPTKDEANWQHILDIRTFSINSSIAKRIEAAMEDLQTNAESIKQKIADIKKRKDEEERKNKLEREKKQDEEVSIHAGYLVNKFKGSEYRWRSIVRSNLYEVKKIIDELKKCESQTGESQTGEAQKVDSVKSAVEDPLLLIEARKEAASREIPRLEMEEIRFANRMPGYFYYANPGETLPTEEGWRVSEANRIYERKLKLKKEKEFEANKGGRTNKKRPKKEILGKMICIYKIPGDRKEYVRHKGKLITVKDYKESMKQKAKKESKPKKKKKST